jgi:predicted acyltransferase (DUF342 family)
MLIWITFILFIIFFILPFMPGIIELIRKKDADPLFIPMDYIRNPRYFGKSFKRLIHRATAGFTFSPGMREVKLSKEEKLELSQTRSIPPHKEINHMLYVIGNFVSGSNARFNKEVYVIDDAVIGSNNVLQALAVDNNAVIGEGVQFLRWLDAEGDVEIDKNCNLGISASAGNRLYMASNCIFRRLFGMPIMTGHNRTTATIDHRESLAPIDTLPRGLSFIRVKEGDVPPGKIIQNNVIFTQKVQVGSDSIIMGDIKCYGDVVLKDNVRIDGNIFADGDIFIGRNARIGGHVFSQMSIYISGQTIISRPDKIKSVIGKKSISIEPDVIIHGYVATEGDGKTV